MRVLVPLGGRTVTGVVLSVRDALPLRARRPARSVSQVLDEAPVLPAILMDVVLRAGDELLCPPGVALMAAIEALASLAAGQVVPSSDETEDGPPAEWTERRAYPRRRKPRERRVAELGVETSQVDNPPRPRAQ